MKKSPLARRFFHLLYLNNHSIQQKKILGDRNSYPVMNKFLSYYFFIGILFLFWSCDFKQKSSHSFILSEELFQSGDSLKAEFRNIGIDSLNVLATKSWENEDYQQALRILKVAFDKDATEREDAEMAKILNTLGLVQWRLGNNEDAMQSYNEAGRLAEKLELYRLLGLTHTNRSLILKEQGDFDGAFDHNNRAIEIFLELKEYRDLGISLNNQGQIFKNQRIHDVAKTYYRRALDSYKKVSFKDGEAASYYNLADIYLREREKDSALEAIKHSLDLGEESGSKIRIAEAYNKMSEIYENFGYTDSALHYYKLYSFENNRILINQQSKRLAEYQVKMGTEVKNLQIQNLQNEQRLAATRYWFIVIVLILCTLIVGFFVYRYFQKLRFRKRSLEQQLVNSERILNIREAELRTYMVDLSKKNEIINSLQSEISALLPEDGSRETEVAKLLEQRILTEEDWIIFKNRFESIYPRFFIKLRQFRLDFTEGEIRNLVLLHLNLSGREMAKILGISPQSVRVNKLRLRKKLEKENFETVESFLSWLKQS